MKTAVSVAIETSSGTGGVALGLGDRLRRTVTFDASARHATELIVRLDALLAEEGLCPYDLQEVYVSVGPGSFTGLRIGVTVARTLAQAIGHLRCVAVPTALAVAENARRGAWEHLGVVMGVKDDRLYACIFVRQDGRIVPRGEPRAATVAEFLAAAPRPITLIGEALARHDFTGPGITTVPSDSPLHVPAAEGVWRVGRRLAAEGKFEDYHRLLPIYTRRPEAVRLWETRHGNRRQ